MLIGHCGSNGDGATTNDDATLASGPYLLHTLHAVHVVISNYINWVYAKLNSPLRLL